jgi:hypothetical protein
LTIIQEIPLPMPMKMISKNDCFLAINIENKEMV